MNIGKCNILDSFGVEHISKETKIFIGNKDTITNNYRTQAHSSIMTLLYQIYWFNVKCLLDYTHLFSRNKYEKNDKIVLKYFQ